MTADASAAPRTGRPHEFFWIWHSAQFSFGTVVLGAVPVSFGLGWWPTVTAVLVGLAVGTVVFAPLVRISMRTGEGDHVSSGAHFGARGRLLTTVITLLVCLVFFAIAVWTGASAVLVAGERLFGTPTDRAALAVALPVVALGVVVVAVFGHTALMRTYRLLTVVGAIVLLVLVAVLAGSFDSGFAGGDLALGEFWPTWLLAAAFAAALPVSYSTLQGDYGAALAPGIRGGVAMAWTGGSMFSSNAVALLVGAMVTTVLVDPSGSWIVGLAGVVPSWFVPVVVVFGVVGTVPQAALCLYAAGLSAQSLRPRSSRAGMTGLVAAVGLTVLYVGAVAFDAIDSISAAFRCYWYWSRLGRRSCSSGTRCAAGCTTSRT